jgi:hypothetical protein
MREEYWSDVYRAGPKGRLAYSFELDFQDLPYQAIERVRTTAEQLLREQGVGRSLVRNTARAIAHLCTVRLAHPEGAPASHYLVQAAWSPKDDDEAIRGDSARIIQWASRMASDEPDTAAALVWGGIVDGIRRGPHPT